jgi:4-hydroxybenzoyl-CoA thioesterase
MLTNRRTVRIEWGDCDPAGIVYYPRYFVMFDNATHALFERALGMTNFEMMRTYGTVGCPMVETSARFLAPTKYGDDITIETTVTEFGRSSFKVVHRLTNGAELAVEAFETRVWAKADPAQPGRIKAVPVPPEVIRRFEGS